MGQSYLQVLTESSSSVGLVDPYGRIETAIEVLVFSVYSWINSYSMKLLSTYHGGTLLSRQSRIEGLERGVWPRPRGSCSGLASDAGQFPPAEAEVF